MGADDHGQVVFLRSQQKISNTAVTPRQPAVLLDVWDEKGDKRCLLRSSGPRGDLSAEGRSSWDAQQAPVGREADLTQGRQIGQPSPLKNFPLRQCVSGVYPLGHLRTSPCVNKID